MADSPDDKKIDDGEHVTPIPRISLRMWLAGQVIAHGTTDDGWTSQEVAQKLAVEAFMLADALIAESKK